MVDSTISLPLHLLLIPPPPEQLDKPHKKVNKTAAVIPSMGSIYDLLYDITKVYLPLHVLKAFTLHVLDISFGNV